MAEPIPPLLRPDRIPRGPQVRYGIDGCAGVPMAGRTERGIPAASASVGLTMKEACAIVAKGFLPPRRIVGEVVENGVRYITEKIARPWRCDHCGATGSGCAQDYFALDEVEHCLTGCNGSLRAVPVYGPEPRPPLAPIPAKLVSG